MSQSVDTLTADALQDTSRWFLRDATMKAANTIHACADAQVTREIDRMTQFKGTGPAIQVTSGGSLTVLTRDPQTWNNLADLVGSHLEAAFVCLETTNRLLSEQPLDPQVVTLADRYFLTGQTIQPEDLEKIKIVVTKTWTGLKAENVRIKVGDDLGAPGRVGKVPTKVEDTDDGLRAAEPTRPWHNQVLQLDTQKLATKGTIALHSKSLNHPGFGTANLLHEASHKFAGTIDYMYFTWGGGGPKLPNSFNDKNKALMNADSYGYFILSLRGRKFDWSTPLVV